MTASRLKRGHARLRLKTLLLIRWVAAFGQATTLAIVYFGFGYPFSILAASAAVAALIAVTAFMQVTKKPASRLSDRQAALNLGFDLVQLSALLFLTGGLQNPFALLILAPVTVSAAVLSYRSTLGLAGLALAAIALLAVFHWPLPWEGSAFVLPAVFVLALAIALVLATIFITSYVFRVAEEARRNANALMAAEASLEREQRLSSVGALAAAAAHELGSPLGTIALVAKELLRDLPADSPHRADIELLVGESQRCRAILAEISRRPAAASADHFHVVPAPLLIELAAEPFLRPHIALRIETEAKSGEAAPPLLPRRPELLRGLGNLLQNAIEFAQEEVLVRIAWSVEELTIAIEDDGPGFPPDLLGRLGDPYVAGHAATAKDEARGGDHMGLGIFIAQNLIERTGGAIAFRNGALGGAEIVIHWPRAAFAAT